MVLNDCIEVPLRGITSVPNFMKCTKLFKLISGTYTDIQTDWRFDKPTFIFESKLKRRTEIKYLCPVNSSAQRSCLVRELT
jgi:hypothetical protein